jgi:hypothetical protein
MRDLATNCAMGWARHPRDVSRDRAPAILKFILATDGAQMDTDLFDCCALS